ncbi:MAG TPA: isochorismate synthase [Opitutae bacterium]|nr:isochorismate synthase [Opitutae bacterium]
MEVIDSKQFPERSKEALEQFLAHCQLLARKRGRAQLVSISLDVKHIDPLAVLQSIYEPSEAHCYLEHPTSEEAIAGAEAVAMATFSGEDRCECVRAWAESILDNTVAIGDIEGPFSGPHFFCSFTFEDTAPERNAEGVLGSFEPATVFVPLWQVGRSGGAYVAVANVWVEPDGDVRPWVERVWQAHAKFSAFDYAGFEESPTSADSEVHCQEVSDGMDHQARVASAVEAIRSGAYQKIVLARALDLVKETPWNPLTSLHVLRQEYPSCFAFSFSAGKGESFVGATPEKILRMRNGRVFTEAIAGSIDRGVHAGEDARLARELLDSDKDRREHLCIVEDITQQLERLGISAKPTGQPRLLPLANVQHLYTPIEGVVPPNVHLLNALSVLHPTPAVGGVPRAAAKAYIHEAEPFNRGLYAGALGWFNARGEGEIVVGLRSALIAGRHARLYAGGGIVEGSDPEREKIETDWKFKVMLDHLN